MKVLIAFEESQAVCKAFRELGHEAYSCDLQDCSGGQPSWHLKMDAMEAIVSRNWDLIIMHPMCTKLSVSGNHVYAKGKPKYHERVEAVKFTQSVWDLAISVCDKVCMENPVGVLNTVGDFPKPQYVQPYEFGHCESKKTGLWLHGLPKLAKTQRVFGRFVDGYERFDNQTDSGQNKLPPTPDRAKIRSKTYSGIAKAMANQWSNSKTT